MVGFRYGRRAATFFACAVFSILVVGLVPHPYSHLLTPSSYSPLHPLSSIQRPLTSSNLTPFRVAPTEVLLSAAGHNVFRNIYCLPNGTFLLLSPPNAPSYDADKGGGGGFIDVRGQGLLRRVELSSTGLSLDEPDEIRDATPENINVLPWEDRALLRLDVGQPRRLPGTTIFVNDAGQSFLNHFYHMWSEVLLAAFYALSLTGSGKEDSAGRTDVAFPDRVLFSNADETQIRDGSGMIMYLYKTILPQTAIGTKYDWAEHLAFGRTVVFDKVVFIDRSASSRGPKCAGAEGQFYKGIADILLIPPLSASWFAPYRQTLLSTIHSSSLPLPTKVPVVTYISRQSAGSRAMKEEVHLRLVRRLEEVSRQNGWELNVPRMESMEKGDQITLASRTDVLLGIHGNGLSHAMFMKPSTFSTVIEIFQQGSANYDFALPAMALGHKHFGIWKDGTVLDTFVDLPKVHFADDFHSLQMETDVEAIVGLIEKRLAGWNQGD